MIKRFLKHQECISDNHVCVHCGITKAKGGRFSVQIKHQLPKYVNKLCNVCRWNGILIGHRRPREADSAFFITRELNRLEVSKRIREYFNGYKQTNETA